MTFTDQAIRKAAYEGGYLSRKENMETPSAWRNRFLLDPAFWEALGKALGWETGQAYQSDWHELFSFLIQGKTVEEYFGKILTK